MNNGMPMFALYREQAFDDEHINAIDGMLSIILVECQNDRQSLLVRVSHQHSLSP